MDPSTSSPTFPGFGTRAVRSGIPRDARTGALTEPIYLSTTFNQQEVGVPTGSYVYSRSGNLNRESFEQAIADLEGAKHAVAFSSGVAATVAVLQQLSSHSHVVSIASLYGGTHRYLTRLAPAGGITVSFTDDIEMDIQRLVKPGTSLVWIESPSNPTLSLIDIQKVADVAHENGALVVVDNTFLSPYIQNPLNHGADVVLHSATKYINGHSDVLMGIVAFNDDKLKSELSLFQNAAGSVPSPFDCWLAHRGLKTLHLRVLAASKSAEILARALESSSHVTAVNYPGLASHPRRHIVLKQHRNGLGGGMISFRLKGGREAAERFCKSTKYFALAESLGGVESLCEVPASMTHAGMPKEVREAAGVYNDLIRLSVGIEDVDDLLRDLMHALDVSAVVTAVET